MLPRLGSSKLISTWIWITLVASIAAAVSGGLMGWAALAPARIWRGEVWRLVTWVFVEPGALSLILTCASIYKFGGELAPRWGDRRLRRFMIEILGGAALATALLGLVSTEVWHRGYLGGWAVCDVLVIAWPDFETATPALGILSPVIAARYARCARGSRVTRWPTAARGSRRPHAAWAAMVCRAWRVAR